MRKHDAIKRTTLDEVAARKSAGLWNSDWERVRAMSEAELERAIADDPDADLPAGVYLPVAADLASWLKAQPEGPVAALDAVLRKARSAGA